MTSVNSPACLLARNNFYRNFPSSPESCGPGCSCPDSDRVKQRQVSLCISMATPHGSLSDVGTKSLSVNIVLSSPRSLQPSNPRNINVTAGTPLEASWVKCLSQGHNDNELWGERE